MVWQETSDENFQVPEAIIDCAFRIECKQLPLDHAHSLTTAVHEALPWFKDVRQAGIHLIHVAESGNGWMRPMDTENEILNVSKRTRFSIRIPKLKLQQLQELEGTSLNVDGYIIKVGGSQIKPLVNSSTLFSRYVIANENESEQAFMERTLIELKQQDIVVKKMMCGRESQFKFPDKTLSTRSIMLAELEREDAIRLQENGLGEMQVFGFGLFIPHRGIAAVFSKE